jgi:predicted Zn-dependent protease
MKLALRALAILTLSVGIAVPEASGQDGSSAPAGQSSQPATSPESGAPSNLAARAAEAAQAMQASRFDEAAAIYAEIVKARPGDAGLLMNLGMAQYMAGRPDAALASLQKAVRLNASLAPASLFLGAALLDLGRAADAIAPLGRAVAAMPDNPDAHEMLARASLAVGRLDTAVTQYRALTTMQADNPKGWYGLSRSYQSMAERDFAAMRKEAPDSPLIDLVVAEVLVSEDRYGQALATYRRVLAANPPVGGIHESIADLYTQAGKPEWAATERERSPARTPAACASKRAECAFLDGKLTDALAAARKTPTLVGKYWAVRAANRLSADAVSHLTSLPDSVELRLLKADIAQSRGRHAEAVDELRGAVKLGPGDPIVEAALAEELIHMRNFEEALPLLERLTRAQPDSASLLFLQGEGLLLSQQLDKAIPILERATKLDPGLLPARASLGRAYVQAGRFQEALPHLEAAAANDDDGDVHYQLARAYQALQRGDEAKAAMAEYQKRQQARAPEPAAPPTNPNEGLTPP